MYPLGLTRTNVPSLFAVPSLRRVPAKSLMIKGLRPIITMNGIGRGGKQFPVPSTWSRLHIVDATACTALSPAHIGTKLMALHEPNMRTRPSDDGKNQSLRTNPSEPFDPPVLPRGKQRPSFPTHLCRTVWFPSTSFSSFPESHSLLPVAVYLLAKEDSGRGVWIFRDQACACPRIPSVHYATVSVGTYLTILVSTRLMNWASWRFRIVV